MVSKLVFGGIALSKIEIPKDNSAGRLYHIVNVIKENHSGSNNRPFTVLAQAFNVAAADKATIIEKYAELFELVKIVKEDIATVEGINHERYLQPVNTLLEALSSIEFNSTNGLYQFIQIMNENVMTRLEFSSDMLSQKIKEDVINEDELNKLLIDVNNLIKSVSEMKINIELKASFLKNLTNIRAAIENYSLWGSRGLQSVIESSLGSILLRNELITSEEEVKTRKKLVEYILEFNGIISAGKKVYDTLEPAIRFFIGTGKDE